MRFASRGVSLKWLLVSMKTPVSGLPTLDRLQIS